MNEYSSDIALFTRFRDGDPVAIKTIYSWHFKPLCYFAERITHNKAESEDIATDTFIKMLDRRESFENLTNVKSFLYISVRNASLNYLKAEKRHLASHLEIGRAMTAEALSSDDWLGNEMIRLQVLQAIHEEIENLPDRCREIFKMLFIEGLSTEVIGERLNISPQTVRTQKARAIQLLKNELLKKNIFAWMLALPLLDWLNGQ